MLWFGVLLMTGNVTSARSSTAKLRAASRADLPSVEQLLVSNKLPSDGVSDSFDDFIVAEADGLVVGAIGLEVYGDAALLRSAVVHEGVRGTGLGADLVDGILRHARARGVQSVFLLTTTAEDYFPRFGFAVTSRDGVPASLKQSREFRGACPDTAILMARRLETPASE